MGIKKLSLGVTVVLIAGLVETFAVGASASVRHAALPPSRPEVTQAAAFDVSPAVRDLSTAPAIAAPLSTDESELPSDLRPIVTDGKYDEKELTRLGLRHGDVETAIRRHIDEFDAFWG